jgi:hypothetical protein
MPYLLTVKGLKPIFAIDYYTYKNIFILYIILNLKIHFYIRYTMIRIPLDTDL